MNISPQSFSQPKTWQDNLAISVHLGLFLCIILIPLSGIIMGMSAGRDLNYFNLVTIKPFAFVPQTEALNGQVKLAHEWISYFLIGLVVLHVIGALTHHFIYKDNVLRRMLPW
jgi:cytochrome b561